MKYFDKVRQEMEDSAKLAGPEKRSADTDPTVSEFDLPALRDSSASNSLERSVRQKKKVELHNSCWFVNFLPKKCWFDVFWRPS